MTLVTILTLTCVDREQHARLPTTRLSVPAPEDTPEILLSAADLLRRRTCALLTRVVQVLSARQGLTGQGLTGQYVPVQLGTGETHWCPALEESVSTTASVRWTVPVSTTTAGLLVRMPVVRMPSVRQGTMEQSAPVHLALWGILLQLVDSQEELRLTLSASLDLNVILTLTFYSSLKTEAKV